MTYADIIVDISHEKLDKSFQYLVPEKLKEEIQVGMVVSIPFGRGNHVRKGYVVGISGEPKVKGIQLKSVAGIENDQETTESRLIALARVDERKLRLYHDPGSENSSSYSEKDESPGKKVDNPSDFQRRWGKASGRA